MRFRFSFPRMTRRSGATALAIALILAAGGAYALYAHAHTGALYATPQEASNVAVRFEMEAYDTIQKNYWNKLSDAELSNLFELSLQNAASTTETLSATDRATTAQMLAKTFTAATSTPAQANLALETLAIALYNLAPAGRDQLFTNQQTTALRQEVSNVHPNVNLYGDLGLATGSSAAQVESAYAAKEKALAASTSPEAKTALAQIAYAKQVLTNANSKALYDQNGIQPTVFAHTIGHTLYLDLSQISPTTLQEFGYAVDQASTTPGLDSMIIDLRGNIGGDLAFTQNFLGLFIGNNQYAFDLYHQGEYQVQRTVEPQFPELSRYKDLAILTDGMTQSTAELTTAAFLRYHLAHAVGTTTRGWGTVENTYPLTTALQGKTYTLLLVNSITLRPDNTPIEGRGVDPSVNTGTSGWQALLPQYFRSASLIKALQTAAAGKPLQ
jgi:hypothetical protein